MDYQQIYDMSAPPDLRQRQRNAAIAAEQRSDPEVYPPLSIDVAVKVGTRYRLALYFLDWDGRDRRTAIEIFDLATLRLLAPVRVVSDYARGKYLVYNLDTPVRIRVDQVRGDNAVLAGLFFDPPAQPPH
jgi:hypothetical protein